MKQTMLMVLGLVLSLTCHARIGWTEQEMKKKYGKPHNSNLLYGKIPAKIYSTKVGDNVIYINAQYHNNKVGLISYLKLNSDESEVLEFSEVECEAILKLNIPGKWNKDTKIDGYKAWARTEPDATAFISSEKRLIVYTEESIKLNYKAKAEFEKKSIAEGL